MSLPDADKRFTFGLVYDVAEVLRRHGYPIPTQGRYEGGTVYRHIGEALFRLIYTDTDLGSGTAAAQPTPVPAITDLCGLDHGAIEP